MEQEATMRKLINDLYEAYDFFNRELFNNVLSYCAIAIDEKRGLAGAYYIEKFLPLDIENAVSDDRSKMDQILLNPIIFPLGEREVLAVLVHEQVHKIERDEYDNSPINGYHNRQWAESMKAVGLYPSSTGEPGGKETGYKLSHYIIEGGLFDVACEKFLNETGFNIQWFVMEKESKKKTSRKRTYRCDCPEPWYSNYSGREAICSKCNEAFVEDGL